MRVFESADEVVDRRVNDLGAPPVLRCARLKILLHDIAVASVARSLQVEDRLAEFSAKTHIDERLGAEVVRYSQASPVPLRLASV